MITKHVTRLTAHFVVAHVIHTNSKDDTGMHPELEISRACTIWMTQ